MKWDKLSLDYNYNCKEVMAQSIIRDNDITVAHEENGHKTELFLRKESIEDMNIGMSQSFFCLSFLYLDS